ncbi:MAG: ABC transporter permease [Terracidiphilus sp.]
MQFVRRIANLFRRSRIRREFDAELQAHIEMRMEDNLAAGMTAEAARRDALVRFGNPAATREKLMHVDAALGLESVGRDIRYALRQLRRSPGFALTAMITLALGIGANVVVFGVLNAILLQPLAVTDPQSLYQLRHQQWMTGRLLTTSYPVLEDLRRRNTTFIEIAGINAYSHAALDWRTTAISVSGDEVTGNYFDLLGVQPQAGRFFHAADEHGPNSAPYVVLSDALWRSAFHSDTGIIGEAVELSKHPFTVVGVAPAAFHGTERFAWPDYWIPIVNQQQVEGWDSLQNRASVAVTVIGRLKPGVTSRQATENLNAISAELKREYPETDDGQPFRLIHPGLIGDEGDVIRGFLWGVTVLALLVLAAACANLATLFAARATDRSRELALRIALGSSRRRLVRQLLTEALLVSLIGGAAGLVTANLLLGALNRWHTAAESHLAASVDARVFAIGLGLTLVSAMLFGFVPARQAWQSSPLQAMKTGAAESLHLRRFALRDLLLCAQIAICTLLVTASLVAVRGMVRVLHTPLGFLPQGAMLVDLDLGQTGQTEAALSDDAALQMQREIIEAARNIPGVTAVGAVNRTPMTGGLHGVPIFQPGTTRFTLGNSVLAPYVFTMSPGYLDAAGTRLLAGRDVSWDDNAKTPFVAVINETFAQKMWGNAPAIGQHFIVSGNLTEVIGVAQDGKYHDLQESPPPVAYLPLSQNQDSGMIFVVRSPRAPNEMTAALQRTLSSIAPNVPITAQSWSDSLADQLIPARAATVALGVMGLLAAMLAVTGIFGMAAYGVSKRLKELGIRVALGASRAQLMQAALGRPMLLLLAGSVSGLACGMLASQLLRRIVYQANPSDPIVLTGAVAAMALLGLVATWIPARRALRINPSSLMREE